MTEKTDYPTLRELEQLNDDMLADAQTFHATNKQWIEDGYKNMMKMADDVRAEHARIKAIATKVAEAINGDSNAAKPGGVPGVDISPLSGLQAGVAAETKG